MSRKKCVAYKQTVFIIYIIRILYIYIPYIYIYILYIIQIYVQKNTLSFWKGEVNFSS